ncbi:hypothetical protein [Pseudomonas sp. M47T1]|uniref:hypothetical protein n=1 Tax=Pseudomonas sp. M47T1 TaxID=1179778 RepID=UPI0015A645E1|nr:hypothetical protein [Pseudomonas sp. M47T1]
MDDFARRFAEQGYEPHADDCSHLVKALNEHLHSPGDSHRLRRLYDSLIDAADDGADEGLLRHATELADLVASRIEPENGCLVLYSCSNAWAAPLELAYSELVYGAAFIALLAALITLRELSA